MAAVTIYGKSLEPGTKEFRWIDVAKMADGSSITIPIAIVNGSKEGPTLFMEGAVHGEEVIGTEILRNLLLDLDPKNLHGCLLVAPASNYPAYLHRLRAFPLEERFPLYLHGVFPGNPKGYTTERIASFIHNELLLKSNYFIDLHAGVLDACTHPLAHVWSLEDPRTREGVEGMAKASGLPVLVYASEAAIRADCRRYGSELERTNWGQALINGIPCLIVEMGEGSRINDDYVQIGLKALKNIMKYLKMIDGQPEVQQDQRKVTEIVMERGNYGGGLLHYKAKLGQSVTKGDLIAEITDPFRKVEEIRASTNGIIIRVLTLAISYPGAEIAWIAK